ncbi:hypothetical protein [Altericroceibacterium endophyticum]|uniref:Uncharacterized protein n=1 Tax=Altericroceibacterium endophyticum TaxID=1808508 RepID=A0A6I4T6S3_9SPHN|nr:hypothetical protein [Altericroceibacterium endophyticum]MXO66358.1 hypothetical protein [Altericroceibacterium endophyticum]
MSISRPPSNDSQALEHFARWLDHLAAGRIKTDVGTTVAQRARHRRHEALLCGAVRRRAV